MNSKFVNGSVISRHSGKMFLNGVVKEPVKNLSWRSSNLKSYHEKLKHLLENGNADKVDEEDPYAFQESDQPNPVVMEAKIEPTSVSLLLNQRKGHSPLYATPPQQLAPPVPSVKLYNPSNVIKIPLNKPNTLSRPSKSIIGKPLNFGKSQMSKLAIAKIEKAIEGKNRGGPRSKPLNALHKTASLSRLVNKPKRVPPIRSASLDCDVTVNKGKVNTVHRKGTQDDSLLGSKISVDTELSCSLINTEVSQIQTALPTVPFIPKPLRSQEPTMIDGKLYKHESLQRIWAVRNQLKHLDHNYKNFSGILFKEHDGIINDDSDEECYTMSQKHWFSLCSDDAAVYCKRDAKLATVRAELRQKVQQLMWQNRDSTRAKKVALLVASARNQPNLTAALLKTDERYRVKNLRLRKNRCNEDVSDENCVSYKCPYEDVNIGLEMNESGDDGDGPCGKPCVPCIGFCEKHLLRNPRQVLFGGSCSAPMSPDSKPCGAPLLFKKTATTVPSNTFGIISPHLGPSSTSVSPNDLCQLHLRLQENMLGVKLQRPPAPSHNRKRNRSTLGSGRSRKRKRHNMKEKKSSLIDGFNSTKLKPFDNINSVFSKNEVEISDGWTQLSNRWSGNVNQLRHAIKPNNIESGCINVNEENEFDVSGAVDGVEEELELQAVVQEVGSDVPDVTALLEEHDLTNVLAHIPADAFTDLFREDKDEFVPTAQETEELERALEAVDKDMKSLLGVDAGVLPQDVINPPVYYNHNGNGLEQLLHTTSSSNLHCQDAANLLNTSLPLSFPLPISADVLHS